MNTTSTNNNHYYRDYSTIGIGNVFVAVPDDDGAIIDDNDGDNNNEVPMDNYDKAMIVPESRSRNNVDNNSKKMMKQDDLVEGCTKDAIIQKTNDETTRLATVPSRSLLACTYLTTDVSPSSSSSFPLSSFRSYEMVGAIKTIPEDFIVREMIPEKYWDPPNTPSRNNDDCTVVTADIDQNAKDDDMLNKNHEQQNIKSEIIGTTTTRASTATNSIPAMVSTYLVSTSTVEEQPANAVDDVCHTTNRDSNSIAMKVVTNSTPVTLSSRDQLTLILKRYANATETQEETQVNYNNSHGNENENTTTVTTTNDEENASIMLQQLDTLHNHAVSLLLFESTNSVTPATNSTFSPPTSPTTNSTTSSPPAIRISFPYRNSDNNSHDTIKMNGDSDHYNKSENSKMEEHSSSDFIIQNDNNCITINHNNSRKKNQSLLSFDLSLFYDTLRDVYPLLKSIPITGNKNDYKDTSNNSPNVCTNNLCYEIDIFVDDYFNELIQYLIQPNIDIPILMHYYKRGYKGNEEAYNIYKGSGVTTGTTYGSGHCKIPRQQYQQQNKRRGRRNNVNSNNNELTASLSTTNSNHNSVVLVLKPNLSKDDRRFVHRIIDTKTKGLLGTNTIPEYPLLAQPSKENNNSPTESIAATTAIVVSWTKIAERKYRNKKRKNSASNDNHHCKRSNNNNTISGSSAQQTLVKPMDDENNHTKNDKVTTTTTLCVLKKRQREHLAALTILSKALYCRQPDIGLAGMKDMYAVTYQFCTIKNVPPKRIHNSRKYLQSNGMDIIICKTNSNANSNWSLRKGDLIGNKFEIIVRNMQRVTVVVNHKDKGDMCDTENERHCEIQEHFVPVDDTHLERMVNRIRVNGYVNFYGEQRVGEPGHVSVAGVRAFDIGRAMLQKDYMKAIDLILTGRRLINGMVVNDESNDDNDSCNNATNKDHTSRGDDLQAFRHEWKRSGGNIDSTMKKLPKSSSVLSRERLVLKGLKRYGKDNALAALRCLQHNDRMFFIHAYQSYLWNIMTTERLRKYGCKIVSGDLILRKNSSTVEVFSSDTADAAYLCIHDVVLPLPGYDIVYPNNEIGTLYRQFLVDDCINFVKDSKIPEEGTAKGSYRHIVTTAINNEVQFSRMSSIQDEDVSVDCNGTPYNHNDIKFVFQLPKGSYATMFLRELMLTTVVRDKFNKSNETVT